MKEAIYLEKEKVFYDIIYASNAEEIINKNYQLYPDLENYQEAVTAAKTIMYVLPDIYYVAIVENVFIVTLEEVKTKSSEIVWEGFGRDKEGTDDSQEITEDPKNKKMYS